MNKGETYGTAVVVDRHGEELASWPIGPEDTMDPEQYAERFMFHAGYTIEPDKPGARIPDGCEDIRIEIRTESGTLWTAKNYAVVPE